MDRVSRREPRDWWNPVALGLLAVVVMMMIWMTACSSGSQGAAKTNKAVTPRTASSASTAQGSGPTSLSNASEYGENIYDYAKANDWKNAGAKAAALKDTVKQVRTDVKNQSSRVQQLEKHVTAVDSY